MRGRASATSLLRLVLCAGFLCVAWILLSPGGAQAAERVRPELGTVLTGAAARGDITSRPLTQVLTSVETTTTRALVREATTPVRDVRRPSALTPTAPEPVRTADRSRSLRAVVEPATTEVDTLVRRTTSQVSATLTTTTNSVPIVHEQVHSLTHAVTGTLRAVEEGVLELGAVAIPVLELPLLPELSERPTVVGPVVGGARSVGGTPAEGTPELSRGLTNDGAGQAFSDTNPTLSATGPGVAPAEGAVTPFLLEPGGAARGPGGMPLATAPSGASAGHAGGHGGAADGVVPRSALSAPEQQETSSRADDSAPLGVANRPGSRPD